ncbi:MAG: type II toxin-antitoxin system VapB family antitoxin [Euzebya sp.]
MATTPLRDVPDDVMNHFTEKARREGVSRNVVLVRVLTDAARRDQRPALTADALARSAQRTRDLEDPEVMAGAWA